MNGLSTTRVPFDEPGSRVDELVRNFAMTSATWLRAIRSADPSFNRAVHKRPSWTSLSMNADRTIVERCSCTKLSVPSFAIMSPMVR